MSDESSAIQKQQRFEDKDPDPDPDPDPYPHPHPHPQPHPKKADDMNRPSFSCLGSSCLQGMLRNCRSFIILLFSHFSTSLCAKNLWPGDCSTTTASRIRARRGCLTRLRYVCFPLPPSLVRKPSLSFPSPFLFTHTHFSQ
jgi:hypothetical protein